MDANKLVVLNTIGYQIPQVCGICEHGEFRALSDFGICRAKQYDHLKHSDASRQLSVYRYGGCTDGSWKLDHSELARMGAYEQFRAEYKPPQRGI